MEQLNYKIGIGYDTHRLVKKRKLILGGVVIPYKKGLLGHSDADCLIHSIMDAVLGAIGERDIGFHFPDSDNKYKNISSLKLLEIVSDMLDRKGYIISNIDSVIIAQEPHMNKFIPKMTEEISKILKCELSRINIKATTQEGLGFIGKKRAISCQSICLVERNNE